MMIQTTNVYIYSEVLLHRADCLFNAALKYMHEISHGKAWGEMFCQTIIALMVTHVLEPNCSLQCRSALEPHSVFI